MAERLRPLGKGGAMVSALGVGTNRWRQGANDAAVLETWRAVLDGSAAFIDTAEIYGFGKSERLIGECLRADPRPAFVASKFAPFVARASPRRLLAALDASLARLGLETLDLYYIHFPFPFADLDALADAMVEAVKAGKIRHVEVSNFSADQMRRMADRLARASIPLAANEVNYSLLHRAPETNGVLDACRELEVALVAYFPLAAGRLTGGGDGRDGKIAALRQTLAGVAEAYGASVSQAALNWLLARDPHVIPIPSASKARHVEDNLKAFGWSLSEEQFAAIDKAASPAG